MNRVDEYGWSGWIQLRLKELFVPEQEVVNSIGQDDWLSNRPHQNLEQELTPRPQGDARPSAGTAPVGLL